MGMTPQGASESVEPTRPARHYATTHLLNQFRYEHLATGDMRKLSARFAQFAHWLVGELGDGPELSAGLRKLIEAKDCAVRQMMADRGITAPNRVVEQSPAMTPDGPPLTKQADGSWSRGGVASTGGE